MASEYLQLIYQNIDAWQKCLEQYRKDCKHKETYEWYYSWRVGCIQKAKLCKNCDQFIEYLPEDEKDIVPYEISYIIGSNLSGVNEQVSSLMKKQKEINERVIKSAKNRKTSTD